MPWSKQQYIDNYPDAPNPYSRSDEPCRGGALVDDAAMLRAMEAEEQRLANCICSWDVDGRTPKAGCVAHAEEDAE